MISAPTPCRRHGPDPILEARANIRPAGSNVLIITFCNWFFLCIFFFLSFTAAFEKESRRRTEERTRTQSR